MGDLVGSGTAEDSGAHAGTGSTEKAVDQAFDDAKKKLVTDLDDDNDWWKEGFTSVTITTEKPEDLASDKASTKWRLRMKAIKKRDEDLPKNHTKVVKPADVTDLCGQVEEDSGSFDVKVDKPFSKGKAVGEAIEKVRKSIRDARCAQACPDMRARVDVSLSEIGSSGDRVNYKVKWWVRIYCFNESDEKP